MKQHAHSLLTIVAIFLMGSQLYATDPIPLDTLFISNSSLPALVYLPGSYFFIEDLMYNPDDGTPALTIVSSEVNIDFNNLSLNHINTVPGVSGVSIQPGVFGCNLSNGAIRNFSQSAITTDSNTAAVVLTNLVVSGCAKRAIEFNGTVDNPINLVQMVACSIVQSCTSDGVDNVLTFSNCANGEIQNCILSGNGSSAITNQLALVNFTNCSQFEFVNNVINSSIGNTEVNGLYLNNCITSLFRDNKISTLIATGTDSVCRGIHLVSDSGSMQNNFFNNIVGNLTASSTVDGYFVGRECHDNYFEQCSSLFNSVTGSTGTVHGFRSVGNNRTKFNKCTSRTHSAPNSSAEPHAAYGFTLDTVERNDILDCLSTDNSAAGSSVGIYATQTTKCHFNGNKSLGHTQGCDFEGTFDDNIWLQNMASKNSNAAQLNGFPANAVTDSQLSSSVNTITAPWTNVGIA
jgi:hypothetical protein